MFGIKALIAVIVLFTVTIIIGTLWSKKEGGQPAPFFAGTSLIMGIVTVFAVFQLLSVPMILMKVKLSVLTYLWLGAVLLLFVAALFLRRNRIMELAEGVSGIKKMLKDRQARGCWFVFAALLVFQLVVTAGTYTGHEDDNRYVAEVVDAVETDTMLQYHPFTGEFYGEPKFELLKDAVAPINMLWAALCVLFSIHPAAFMHTVIPLMAIPLCYYVYSRLARRLMKGDSRKSAMFLIVLWLFFMMNHITPMEGPGRLLYYMWWGKSWLAAFYIPLVIDCFLGFMEKETGVRDYLMLGTILLSACLTTSMAPIMLPLMAGIYGLTDAFLHKKLGRVVYPVLACMPALAYGVLFFLVDRV